MLSLAAIALLNLLLGAEIPASEVVWERDWKHAFERARAEQKMIFVDFWAAWCKPCLEMDRRTFPDPRVSVELSDFVLLKMDVDRTTAARTRRVSSFPTYIVFDPAERERFRFSGFQEPEPFASKLSLTRRAAPGMIQAALALSKKESADGFFLLGHAYLKARATADAREAFEHARKLAAREGNAALAQAAETQAALTWTLESNAEKTLKLLEKIAEKPANAECETGVWIAIGHTRRTMKDTTAAAAAYKRALAACPEN
ncbi:MAG TPA: thioredoxin family protein, partial [Thermoanaerobaculia bacterium]|nr:thioredoxin family protein [Thermoanaerobaculia bacterium]